MKRRQVIFLAVASVAVAAALPAAAKTSTAASVAVYPVRPIRMIMPFPAGGATDSLARALSQKLGEKIGPDGYTLLLATSSTHSIGPAINPKIPHNAGTYFTPIAYVASSPTVVLVPMSSPARTMQEFIGVKDGKLRALAVTSLKRTARAPDLPAVSEVLPDFESVTWFGVYGPKDRNAELTARFNQALNAALSEPDVKERFAGLGADPTGGAPQAFAAMVRADNAR